MRRFRNILVILFLVISGVFVFSFLGNGKVEAGPCYEHRCVNWNYCCSVYWGQCRSCCLDYADVEVPCPEPPCDNSCNGSCSGTCPAGYTKTNPNNLCSSQTVWAGCSYTNGCGNGCSGGSTCYRLETNIAPSTTPSSVSMNVDGVIYVLSTNVNNPTVVKRPKDPNVNIFVNPTIAPNANINRGVGYTVNLTANGTNGYVESTTNNIPFPLTPSTSYLLNGTSGNIRSKSTQIGRASCRERV